MPRRKVSPYGSWKSPITSDLIVSETIFLGAPFPSGADLYWIEVRPGEGGRYVLVTQALEGGATEVTPAPWNVRTRVHEYGGGAYTVADGVVYFTNFADQRLYRLVPGSEPQPITPEENLRFADLVFDSFRNRLICVREDHRQSDQEAENSIIDIDLGNQPAAEGGRRLVLGDDFYSNPRLSPDGSRLAWLSWNHPNLPWDGTELWVGQLDEGGVFTEDIQKVAGGPEESIFQPEWSPDGQLYFVSDRSGWWNLYRWSADEVEAVLPLEAEFGLPQWAFGTSTYAFLSDRRLVCAHIQHGESHLAYLDLERKTLEDIDIPFTSIWAVRAALGAIYFMGGSPAQPASLIRLDVDSNRYQVIKSTTQLHANEAYLSLPQVIEFPTEHGLTAFGFFYPPQNADFKGPDGEKPPLLVMSHGGPTGSTDTTLNLEIQYWTSRGIAVLDVNYGGSTGYGRAYRKRLEGQWGVVDMDDCVNGARYLVSRGLVDGNRLAITGGSAGGYTTLCALTFRDTFRAGASHFGIGDLVTFVGDTHKFESRYLDRLVGPYPERRDLYLARSPIYHIDQLATPVILFQGLEDKIVPPNQAESMFAAVKAKGLPVAYLPFEGEQHGFRKAENIKRALDAELYFYSRIFGFELADPVEPVQIENLT